MWICPFNRPFNRIGFQRHASFFFIGLVLHTCCRVHRQSGRCWGCRTPRERWRTGLCSWKRPQLKEVKRKQTLLYLSAPGSHWSTNIYIYTQYVCIYWKCLVRPTVAGQPLRLVHAGRQRREGEHVGLLRDALAHVLLLQIGTLLQIVVNSPWEDRVHS